MSESPRRGCGRASGPFNRPCRLPGRHRGACRPALANVPPEALRQQFALAETDSFWEPERLHLVLTNVRDALEAQPEVWGAERMRRLEEVRAAGNAWLRAATGSWLTTADWYWVLVALRVALTGSSDEPLYVAVWAGLVDAEEAVLVLSHAVELVAGSLSVDTRNAEHY